MTWDFYKLPLWKDEKSVWLTSSSLLAVFTESIDCDNGWDCMGFCPIWPTGSMFALQLLPVTVFVATVVVNDCDGLELVKFELSTTCVWLIGMTVVTAGDGELKLVDVLIDLICCWAAFAVAIKFGIWVGIVAVGDDDVIIDFIWVNAGDLAAIGKFWRMGECWGWWNGASGWWCGKLATAACADCDANK